MTTMHTQVLTTTDLGPREPRSVRPLLGLAMLLAPWGFVVANTAYMLAIRDGGNEDTSLDTLALYAAHPGLLHVAVVGRPGRAASSSCRPCSACSGSHRRTGWCGRRHPDDRGVHLLLLPRVVGADHLAMAEQGEPALFAKALDAAQGEVAGIAMFALFAIGNLIGTLLLAIGLLRTRAVPVWAAVGILLWPVLHVVGLAFFGNEVPQVVGAVTQAIGFGACALVLLKG